MKLTDIQINSSGSNYDVSKMLGSQPDYNVTQDWQRAVIIGQYVADGGSPSLTANPQLRFRLDYSGYAANYIEENDGDPFEVGDVLSDIEVYTDCVQYIYSSSQMDIDEFQPGDLTVAGERAIVPISGLDTTWTASFIWKPTLATREIKADIPVATIKGIDGAYLYLYYDQSEGKFALYDGTGTQLSAAVSWRQNDVIKFAIVDLGNHAGLYVETIKEGALEVAVLTNGSLGEPPVALYLNENSDASAFGAGQFSLMRFWDSALSADDVGDVFDYPINFICPPRHMTFLGLD